ncbi:HD-GYP domain-containing protein [Paludibacterium denitrificans]|nr:HD-GYP domain-containing protein [Paludibacterium denitrificans]
MVDLRDPYTAGHERRVGLIAYAIARELGWEPERCNAMEMTGLVHDIGKIAIPAEILSKPTRLTPLEMAMVRGHAQAGYDILKDVPFAAPVAEAIRQHHERMDGSGYPQGLKGDEILPEARVLAVADVIESMAAHRPYRAALGLNTALAEIEQGKGRLYDTEVAEAALRLVREKGYQLPQ